MRNWVGAIFAAGCLVGCGAEPVREDRAADWNRSGDAVAIAAYLGTSETFDGAIADFSEAYAELNARDHAAYVAAIEARKVSVPPPAA